ncbi:MAG: hypothetical protein JWO84_43 [Parcubacteria group bacterium]|nr:hypothetical protein [Parcubacteria group bacterium]
MNLRYMFLGAALVLASCSPKPVSDSGPPGVVSEDQITELMACITANKCKSPTVMQKLIDGDTMHAIVGENEGGVYRYFYTDNKRFGIMITDRQKRILLLEDNNLDGKIDYVEYRQDDGKMGGGNITEANSSYPSSQRTYVKSMAMVAGAVPDDIHAAVKATH